MSRSSVLISITQAISAVRPGDRIGVGGSLAAGHPMALVRALIRHGAGQLRIVEPTAGLDLDMLVASGLVEQIVSAFTGAEDLAAVTPVVARAVQDRRLQIWEADEEHCLLALRAAAQGLPFLPTRSGLGTSLPDLNPDLVPFDDPIEGEPLLAVPALPLDVALLAAEEADAYGNVRTAGSTYLDLELAAAARRVVVQVEREVSNAEIRRDPSTVRFWPDAAVVIAPSGTHPFSSRHLTADRPMLADYVRAARDDAGASRWLDEWARGPVEHADYLSKLGRARLQGLAA